MRERRRYTEEYADEEELLFGGRAFDVDEKLGSDAFSLDAFDNRQDFLTEMSGEELTIAYIQKNGFERPILVKHMKGQSRINGYSVASHLTFKMLDHSKLSATLGRH